jgi:hypothetical protein
MTTIAELFSRGEPAWVPLANIFQLIEQKLQISRDLAVGALRPGLESGAIRTDVVGWDPSIFAHVTFHAVLRSDDWAVKRENDVGYSVSEAGWQHVNWKKGSLKGHAVRVMWADVRRELAHLIGTLKRSSSSDTTGGLPEDMANDPQLRAAYAAMLRYVEARFKNGRKVKRNDAARAVHEMTRLPVRKAIPLYRYLPAHLRNRGRTPNS